MEKKIAIIAEHGKGKVKPVTYELYTLAKKIQELSGVKSTIQFFILGQDTKLLARSISENTGEPAQSVAIPGPDHYNGAVYKRVLSALFTTTRFDYICAPHSTSGMDYAPALSVVLNGSCITGVESVIKDKGELCFVRSLFGQKISATLVPESFPLVMTLQPGSYKSYSCQPDPLQLNFLDKQNTGKIEPLVYDYDETNMVFTGTRSAASAESDLGKADVIVSGGRGITEKENYQYIEMLAALFPRSATGGSRPLCDYGWVKYSKQVGLTGTTVSPKLYIACGISGATQHVEAIRDSNFIVAINTDPDAPVFRIADVCILADLTQFIPLFVEKFNQKKTAKIQ
jgi:electron transfer flavoprotein alpha subunit